MLEKTNIRRYWLRRFVFSNQASADHSYHNAIGAHLGDFETNEPTTPDRADPRWPKKCDHCSYLFTPEDEWQVFGDTLYSKADGSLLTLEEAEPGAMWFADYYISMGWVGPDGRCLEVKTPGGCWVIDSRARNCTKPEDNIHRCWIRSGVPPNINVDKNGLTCAAGAGSILCHGYHGFLRHGVLEKC